MPVRNESPNVRPLYVALTDALEAYGRPFEIIVDR